MHPDRAIIDVVELVMLIAHRARVAFEQSCTYEEYVAHELLLLRALLRLGHQKTGRELAYALGWSPGRVSQVVDALVEKGEVHRAPRRGRVRPLSITEPGLNEAASGAQMLAEVGAVLTAGVPEGDVAALRDALASMASRSESLWRIRRSAYES